MPMNSKCFALIIFLLVPSSAIAKAAKIYPASADFYAILQKTLGSRLDRTREMHRRHSIRALTNDDCGELSGSYALEALNTPQFDAESALSTGYRIFAEIDMLGIVYFEADYDANLKGRSLSPAQKIERYRNNRQVMKRLRERLVHEANIDLVLRLASGPTVEAVQEAIQQSPLAASSALWQEESSIRKQLPFTCRDDGSLVKNEDYKAVEATPSKAAMSPQCRSAWSDYEKQAGTEPPEPKIVKSINAKILTAVKQKMSTAEVRDYLMQDYCNPEYVSYQDRKFKFASRKQILLQKVLDDCANERDKKDIPDELHGYLSDLETSKHNNAIPLSPPGQLIGCGIDAK